MLLLQYDPATTELVFREQPLPPVTANFSEFNLTTTISLNAGTVTVNGYIDMNQDGNIEVGVSSIVEVL
jgi:hypothetical protein